MNAKTIKYYKEYCDEPKFEGEQKKAMEFAMDNCNDFLNGLEEGLNIDDGYPEERTKGFYIELCDVAELMNKWKNKK